MTDPSSFASFHASALIGSFGLVVASLPTASAAARRTAKCGSPTRAASVLNP